MGTLTAPLVVAFPSAILPTRRLSPAATTNGTGDRTGETVEQALSGSFSRSSLSLPSSEAVDDLAQGTLAGLMRSWFAQLFPGKRLRSQLLGCVLGGLLIHGFVVVSGSHHGRGAWQIGTLLGLLSSFPACIVVRNHTASHILNNLYFESRAARRSRRFSMFVVLALSLAGYLLPLSNLQSLHVFQYLAVPGTLLFPGSYLLTLLWLLRYESRYGPVYIAKDAGRSG